MSALVGRGPRRGIREGAQPALHRPPAPAGGELRAVQDVVEVLDRRVGDGMVLAVPIRSADHRDQTSNAPARPCGSSPRSAGRTTRLDRLPSSPKPVTLLLLVATAIATACAVAVLAWRWAAGTRRPGEQAMGTARRAGAAVRRHPGRTSALAARLDPGAATGLALTLALL